jgi:hypothetical protein
MFHLILTLFIFVVTALIVTAAGTVVGFSLNDGTTLTRQEKRNTALWLAGGLASIFDAFTIVGITPGLVTIVLAVTSYFVGCSQGKKHSDAAASAPEASGL